jgi:hypothetical protein
MINNSAGRLGANSSQAMSESDSSSDFSVDSEARRDAQNADKVDRGETAWSQYESGKNKAKGQLFLAAEAGVFKARLGMMQALCRPSSPSTAPEQNNFFNALLWGKKAINCFQAMNKTKHMLAISEPDSRPNSQNLKSIFINYLDIADSQTENNHRLGTQFASYNKTMPDEEIQQKVDLLENRFSTQTLSEQEFASAFGEMQYLSNIYIAKNAPDKAVAIYDRLLPLLPTATPPWQTSTN